jgi:hypothetical protein
MENIFTDIIIHAKVLSMIIISDKLGLVHDSTTIVQIWTCHNKTIADQTLYRTRLIVSILKIRFQQPRL